jgi:cytoskeletal protein CcmA (bactofilin family)
MFRNENGAQKDSMDMTVYMGPNMEFKGTLTFEGTGRIDGKVDGKIIAKGMTVVGEGAVVSFEIESDTVVVGGKVEGKIIGREKVQLLKTAVVNADIITPCFSIEEGCRFNGTCRMSNGSDVVSPSRRPERELQVPAGIAVR